MVKRSLASVVGGQRVLVTGASSGVGRALAVKLGAAGADVLLVARTEAALDEVRATIEARGGRAFVHPADLAQPDDIDRLTAEVLERHDGVDVLINNAGISIRRTVEQSYDRFHDFERTARLNYLAPVQLILAVLPGMRERRRGHIINISTMGTQLTLPRFAAYVASKSALDAFASCMATEVSDTIDITTVHLGLVRTPMSAPTAFYARLPSQTADGAADTIARALVKKPARVANPIGTMGQLFRAVAPGTFDHLKNSIFQRLPDLGRRK